MPHGMTGQGGRVLFGAVGGSTIGVMNCKLTRWRLRMRNRRADDTGAGEYFESSLPVRSGWEVEIQGLLPAQANRYVLSTNESSFGGAEGVVALAQLPTDTHPFFAGIGAAEDLEFDSPIDGPITFTCRIVCCNGTQPYMNTTPA